MKINYINILLFALPLNILLSSSQVHNQRNCKNTTLHTKTYRSLCECDLYMPNYDKDPQMKEVMDNFNKQTQQRFEEYDERMKNTRQKCKDECDKEIQKIILKDKLEKELMDKFATLNTDIQSDAIPTCTCEKSIADKVEKGCLRCGGVLGGGVAPGVWLFGTFAVDQLTKALAAAAKEYATQEGIKAGVQAVITKIENNLAPMLPGVKWPNFITGSNYSTAKGIMEAVKNAMDSTGKSCISSPSDNLCITLSKGETTIVPYLTAGKKAYTEKFGAVKAIEVGKVTAENAPLYSAITYSVLAIIIIVLIMIIIYLILRRRRKKKMKKKLQYIKLLEE
ncbi:rifin PIR protein,putative [Plasmodium sp. DRC-Itaito]|nr:rifin PIR protein,putative [Plasmodium sp. DRC-Itaito]